MAELDWDWDLPKQENGKHLDELIIDKLPEKDQWIIKELIKEVVEEEGISEAEIIVNVCATENITETGELITEEYAREAQNKLMNFAYPVPTIKEIKQETEKNIKDFNEVVFPMFSEAFIPEEELHMLAKSRKELDIYDNLQDIITDVKLAFEKFDDIILNLNAIEYTIQDRTNKVVVNAQITKVREVAKMCEQSYRYKLNSVVECIQRLINEDGTERIIN